MGYLCQELACVRCQVAEPFPVSQGDHQGPGGEEQSHLPPHDRLWGPRGGAEQQAHLLAGQRVAVQGVLPPHWLSCSFQAYGGD